MASQKYILPNAAAIRKLLAQESDVTSAAIIRLAWQAGLTATEIVNLRWTDINFDNGTLSVSGRIVPASSDLISFLSSMEQVGSYVIYSRLSHGGPTTRNSVSRKARTALDHVGEKASLLELRFDYIVRLLKELPAEEVSRVTGCEIRTLQEINKRYTNGDPNPAPKRIRNHNNYDIDRVKLEKVLKEVSPLDSKIIMLAWMCDLSLKEMSELMWKDLDASAKILNINGRKVTIPQKLFEILSAEKFVAQDGGYILKGSKSADKLTVPFMSRRVGEVFARYGFGGMMLSGIKGKYSMYSDSELEKEILQFSRQNGHISPSEVATQFNLSINKSSKLLHDLTSNGNLKFCCSRYIPAECQSNWDKFNNIIKDGLDSQSNITWAALSAATGISPTAIYYYINKAIEKGILEKLCHGKYHYTGKE